MIAIILLAESWAVIVPVLSVLVSGAFTFVGYMFNNRAKTRDQELAEKTQDLDGIRLGKEFFQDALTDARIQITELKALLKTVQDQYALLQVEHEKQTRMNERLTIKSKDHERKIRELQEQIISLKENKDAGS